MSRRAWLWGNVAVLLLATALRLFACGHVPPGLYHDEAYNGLDALDVLEGRLSFYFAANNGREPLFIYLIALTVGLLGRSPLALRLASFPIGLLTVAATAAMGRALFSRRVGLLAAAVLAVTLWHVHLSRVGFRAVLLPLFTALFVWLAARGARTGRRGYWIAAGALYGLSFYSYSASRFTPVALLAWGGVVLWADRRALAAYRTSLITDGGWRIAVAFLLPAALVVAPLALYALAYPDVVLGRPGQVSITNPTINGGDFWGTLLHHTIRTLGMFFVKGDRIWRHNVPWRPVFDPLLGAAFLLGVGAALRRARREPAAAFVLVWTAVMLLPTLLAEDAPHFLRAVGVLPTAALLPALGLDALWEIGGLQAARAARLHWLVTGCVLLFGLGSTSWAYFGPYARDPMTAYWFEDGAATLAGRVNASLAGERRVFLDPWLWAQWPQLRFMVDREAVTVGLEAAPADGATAVFVWPYGEWQRAWALLPAPAEIAVEEGPLSQGDRDPQPYLTYVAFIAAPPEDAPALARFSGGVELLGVSVTAEGERLRVRLRWRASSPLAADYTVFLHYLRDGERIAQADSRPASGRYPTIAWRAGDIVIDDHWLEGIGAPLAGRDALRLGLWQPESGAVLYLLDPAGNPAGDWLTVPLESDG